MTLGNMRELGLQRLIASCLNDACRHVALIDVSSYPADIEVPSYRPRVLRQVRQQRATRSTFAQIGKSNRHDRP